LHGSVFTARREVHAIRRPSDGVYVIGMLLQEGEFLFFGDIPDAYGVICAAGKEFCAIWRPSDAGNGCRMTGEQVGWCGALGAVGGGGDELL